jgi:hypothetical protein
MAAMASTAMPAAVCARTPSPAYLARCSATVIAATPPAVPKPRAMLSMPPVVAATARITSIPTLMAFRDGILVFSQPGALPSAALEQLITAVRELDMVEVRKEVAHQAAA